MLDQKEIARVAYEVNRAYCMAIGDDSLVPWDDAPDWHKETCINGVKFHLESEKTPEQSHESWLAEKESEGWVYGAEKDADKKTHPCMVPYGQLPEEQKVKDYLFSSVVKSLSTLDVSTGSEETIIKEIEVPVVPVSGKTGLVPVRYIGKRPSYKDGTYGTGIIWMKGETQLVPVDKARLLLKHADVYESGEIKEAAPVTEVPEPDHESEQEEEIEDTRNILRNMGTKRELADFIKINFNQEISVSNINKADLVAKAIGLLDQYGMPGQEG